ncbi:MAG: hypothetical protein AMXMBFR37_05930 [Steroidobacteraceae bacterium]
MKPDDSGLDPENLLAVESRARKLLDKASAWERFPTPIDDLLAAAQLKVAPTSIFDAQAIIEYLKGKSADVGHYLKSAISKVFGVYDANESLIHIDDTVAEAKQNFLKLHETGHHELPTHRKLFRFFQDCEKTLSPDIADLFEREANNFARCVLFQGNRYADIAADHAFTLRTPIDLAKKFGASVYASAREFARTNHRACVVYILEPLVFASGAGVVGQIRRIEPSPSFIVQFGRPVDLAITPDHVLGPILPVGGRRMTRATAIVLKDRNGVDHECVAEAFDTKWNVLILVYPVRALTASRIVLPAGIPTGRAGAA